jgi:DNA-binding GntR family transcriptional regulator
MTKPTKAKLIHQAIANDIVHGRLLPGTALDETSIAAMFGVSRTPIREAIRQLEAIGLVEARAQRGAIVATLSDQQLDDLFAVMAEVEALCARWSAIAMTAGERRHLLALQVESARFVSDGRREAYVEFNTRFHEAIYRGAHNGFLAELALNVRKRCAPFRRAQFEALGRLAKSHAEHGAVVTAIQRGDADLAATEMRAHIIVVRGAVDEVTGPAIRRGASTALSKDLPLQSDRAVSDIA